MKGKLFDDGEVRFYVRSKHRWMTEDEILEMQKQAEQDDTILKLFQLITCLGGLLAMYLLASNI